MAAIGESAAKDLTTRGKAAGVGPKTIAEMAGVGRWDIATATPEQLAPVETLITQRTDLLDRLIAALEKTDMSRPASYRDAFKLKSTEELEQEVAAIEAKTADAPAPESASPHQVDHLMRLLSDEWQTSPEFKSASGLFVDGIPSRDAVAALTSRKASEMISGLTRR